MPAVARIQINTFRTVTLRGVKEVEERKKLISLTEGRETDLVLRPALSGATFSPVGDIYSSVHKVTLEHTVIIISPLISLWGRQFKSPEPGGPSIRERPVSMVVYLLDPDSSRSVSLVLLRPDRYQTRLVTVAVNYEAVWLWSSKGKTVEPILLTNSPKYLTTLGHLGKTVQFSCGDLLHCWNTLHRGNLTEGVQVNHLAYRNEREIYSRVNPSKHSVSSCRRLAKTHCEININGQSPT